MRPDRSRGFDDVDSRRVVGDEPGGRVRPFPDEAADDGARDEEAGRDPDREDGEPAASRGFDDTRRTAGSAAFPGGREPDPPAPRASPE